MMRIFISLAFVAFIFGCSTPKNPVAYTAYNLWYERATMDSINYKRGTIIPAGTPLSEIPRDQHQYIFIERFGDGRDFAISFNRSHFPGIEIADFATRAYTDKPFDQLTEGLSEKEKDAIRRGVLVPGMSKRAVLISYGYPPSHRTPDLKADRWTYWISRTQQKEICFDKDERTIRCTEMEDETL